MSAEDHQQAVTALATMIHDWWERDTGDACASKPSTYPTGRPLKPSRRPPTHVRDDHRRPWAV
jgi:hypothetical protein